MDSSDILAEARKWLIELETTDRLEDVWEEFDDWFQASPRHRAAYAKVRRDWLRLGGSPTQPAYEMSPRRKAHRADRHYWTCAGAWISHWWWTVAALLALIVTCVADIYQQELSATGSLPPAFSLIAPSTPTLR